MGELSCGMKCLKYMLFAFNFVFFICGIAVLAVGIYSRIESKDWESILGENGSIASISNLMIAAGCIVVVVAFLGCCGAVKENKCMLVSFAVCLGLVFILEIAAGIYAYIKKDEVIDSVEKNLQDSIMKEYGQDTTSQKGLTESVDWVQQNVECCGVKGPGDWEKSKWFTTRTGTALVPKSCCKDPESDTCSNAILQLVTLNLHDEGCADKGKEYVKDHVLQIGGVGIGIAFVQIFGIVFAVMLCRSVSD